MKGFARIALKFLGLLFAFLLLLLVLIRFLLPPAAILVAEKLLPTYVKTDVSVGKVDLSLPEGRVALRDVRIQHFPDQGEGSMLHAETIGAKVDLISLFKGPITVEDALISDASIHVVRDSGGRFNVETFIANLIPQSPDPSAPQEEEEPGEKTGPGMLILLKRVVLQGLSVTYTDPWVPDGPMNASLRDLDVRITDLLIDTSFGKDLTLGTRYPGILAEGSESQEALGTVSLSGLRVQRPAGFGEGDILSLEEISVETRVRNPLPGPITVTEARVKAPKIHLVRRQDGARDLERIVESFVSPGSSQDSQVGVRVPPSDDTTRNIPSRGIPIRVERFSLDDLSAQVVDRSMQGTPFTAEIGKMSVALTDLLFDTSFGRGASLDDPFSGLEQRQADPAPAKGTLSLENLKMGQPGDMGKSPSVSIPEFKVQIQTPSVLNGPILVTDAFLRKAELHLVRNKEGTLNTERILASLMAADSPEKKTQRPDTAKGENVGAPSPGQTEIPSTPHQGVPLSPADSGTEEPSVQRPIQVRRFAADQLGFSYTDRSLAGEPLHVRVGDIDLQISDLTVAPPTTEQQSLPGLGRLTAHIHQGAVPDALLGLFARIGIVGSDVPPLNGALRLAGLELNTFRAILPPGTGQAIGAQAVDLSVEVALSPSVLDCDLAVKPPAKPPLTLAVGGTPSKPEIQTSSLLLPILLRAGGGLGGMVGNFSGVGKELTGAAVGSVTTLGKGAFSVVSSAGTGLLETAKGAATGNVNTLTEGLKTTTVGTLRDGAQTVTDTGNGLARGVADAGTASVSRAGADAWRTKIPARWEKEWKEAQDRVNKMPFPGSGSAQRARNK